MNKKNEKFRNVQNDWEGEIVENNENMKHSLANSDKI